MSVTKIQLATLVDGKVPSAQLPSFVDDVIEVSSYSDLPQTGESGKIYVTLDTNKSYRWSGSTYIEVSKATLHARDNGWIVTPSTYTESGETHTLGVVWDESAPDSAGWYATVDGEIYSAPEGDRDSMSLSWWITIGMDEVAVSAKRYGYQLDDDTVHVVASEEQVAERLGEKVEQTTISAAFAATTYSVGNVVVYKGKRYRCKIAYTATSSSAKPPDDSTHWEAKTVQDGIDAKAEKPTVATSSEQNVILSIFETLKVNGVNTLVEVLTKAGMDAALSDKANLTDLPYALNTATVTPGSSVWTANYSQIYDNFGELVDVSLPEWGTYSTSDGDKTGWFWYQPDMVYVLLSEDESATLLTVEWDGYDGEEYVFYTINFSKTTSPATVTNVKDRAINAATLGSTVTAATVTLPAAVSGRSRDFYIDLTIEATDAPTLTFIDPATGTTANVAFGADSLADIDTGDNLVLWTELPNNRWLVSVKHEEAS